MKPLLLFTLSASNNSGPVVSSHFVIQLAYYIKFSAAAFESVDSSKAWCWFVFKGSRFGFRTTLCLEMHQHIQAVSRVQRCFLAQLMHSTASAKKGWMLPSSGKHAHVYTWLFKVLCYWYQSFVRVRDGRGDVRSNFQLRKWVFPCWVLCRRIQFPNWWML